MENIPEEHQNNPSAPFNDEDLEAVGLDDVVDDDYTVDDAYDDGLLE